MCIVCAQLRSFLHMAIAPRPDQGRNTYCIQNPSTLTEDWTQYYMWNVTCDQESNIASSEEPEICLTFFKKKKKKKPCCVAFGISVSQPGTAPVPTALGGQCLNQRTPRSLKATTLSNTGLLFCLLRLDCDLACCVYPFVLSTCI